MPELPEVEAARRALHEHCCGRIISSASVADDGIVIDGVASDALEKALTGRKILEACRKGKNIWLQLDERPWPSFQFGMTGAFHIKGKEITKYKRSAVSDKEEWPSKFSKVFFKLDDGLEVSFSDKRRLARVRLLQDPPTAPPIFALGPDALVELPSESILANTILKKKCPIKALLLDQSFLAGIGNWVADEVLYQARIHPEQVASSLSEEDCTALHRCIQEVIKLAVEVDADSERFPENWIFHHRWNKKPGKVDGKEIAFITVGGRTSAYVPVFQKCTVQSPAKKNGSSRMKIQKESETTSVVKQKGTSVQNPGEPEIDLPNTKKGGRKIQKESETTSVTKQKGMKSTQNPGETEINLSHPKKGGRKKHNLQYAGKSGKLIETKETELEKGGKRRKIQDKETTMEETKGSRKGSRARSGKRNAGGGESRATVQEVNDKEQAISIGREKQKQGRSLAKKQIESQTQQQAVTSTFRKDHNNDDVGNKVYSDKSSAGKAKKGSGNELSKPVSILQESDGMKMTKGEKRKRGI